MSRVNASSTWGTFRRSPGTVWLYGFLILWAAISLPDAASDEVLNVSPTAQSKNQAPADYSFHGTCVSQLNKTPLEGVHVRLFAMRGLLGDGEEIANTQTDNAGTFKFSGLRRPSALHTQKLRYVVVATFADGPAQEYPVSVFGGFRGVTIGFHAEFDSLKGRVVDEAGKPIQGALVRTMFWTPPKAAGTPFYETKEDGLFLLHDLPVTNAEQSVFPVQIYVSHPDFPSVRVPNNKIPGGARVVLNQGCKVTGTVLDANSRPVAGVVVSAVPEFNANGIFEPRAETDAEGRFRLCLNEGVYSFVLDDKDLVAEASTGIECRKTTSVTLKPMLAQEGAWLVGQIINTRTGQAISEVDVGDGVTERVAIGVFGPARPRGTDRLAEVDEHGRFRIRVMPGEYYPFTINYRTSRMSWDTQRQSPVVVVAGAETYFQIDHTPEETLTEKMAKALKILESLPKETDRRVEAIIDEFRKLNHTVGECEIWCLLMQELITIGKPAVLPLCREFESTSEQRMMRRLAFALRAIGDPRAVPTLIRVLPKTLQPPMSDYGLIVVDADLTSLMRLHSIDFSGQSMYFDFGRPVRETVAALNKLTGRSFNGSELASFTRRKDLRSLARQEKFYYDAAHEWADWWEVNWQSFGNDPEFSKVNLPAYKPQDLTGYPTGRELTENSATDVGVSGAVLSPVGDADHGAEFFADLDSGKRTKWPKELPTDDADPPAVESASKWAAGQGVDLMCVAQTDKDGMVQYVLVGIGLQLWEIDALDVANIEQRLKEGKLPEGRKLDQPAVLHFDEKSGKYIAQTDVSFLYLRKDHGLGIITITDFVTKARDITGMAGAPKGVGFHRGVRFDVTAIAR